MMYDLDSLSDKEILVLMTATLGTLMSRYEGEDSFTRLEDEVEKCCKRLGKNYDSIWNLSIKYRRGQLLLG